jgi:hypothetical protein
MARTRSTIYARIESEIDTYISHSIELSERVEFSQYKTINRIYRFRNRDLSSGNKINSDLSYDYFYDIISPRVDSEVKNLRFDTKHIMVFSQNPLKDFPAVFISNASLKRWMTENGEDEKLKSSVEEFSANGNIGFKKVKGRYEQLDVLNTYVTNQKAKTVDDTDLIERHEMTASQLVRMSEWDQDVVKEVIEYCGNKTFTASEHTTPIQTTSKRYEIFEFTGEVSEAEFNALKGTNDGDENTYFLAKLILAGLRKGGKGEKYVLFAEKLTGKMSDYYKFAHRGRYDGRFWRVGIYEMLFDHQIRANEIGNQLARGLEWASKVVFKSEDSKILTNIRADIDNGDVILTKDLSQVDVRLHNLDQLIADWNRLLDDVKTLTNSYEVVTGESMPANTPFRMGMMLNENAGKMFVYLRQKITLPYQHVFREWVLPELVKDLKGEDIFRLTGDNDILDQLREVMVESWYAKNLVQIGPHTKEIADAIKQDKLDQLRKVDPVIKNVADIWKGVLPRLDIVITGENSNIEDQMQDLINLLSLEQDPDRINWILDMIYKIRNIPIPPRKEQQPPENQLAPEQAQQQGQQPPQTQQQSPGVRQAQQPIPNNG